NSNELELDEEERTKYKNELARLKTELMYLQGHGEKRESFDAHEIAEAVVALYDEKLAEYKISLGIEGKLSDEEIIDYLNDKFEENKGELSLQERQRIKKVLNEARQEARDRKSMDWRKVALQESKEEGVDLTRWQKIVQAPGKLVEKWAVSGEQTRAMYFWILSQLFKGKKRELTKLVGYTVGTDIASYYRTLAWAQFIEAGGAKNLAQAGLSESLDVLVKNQFSYELSALVNQGLLGEKGIAELIFNVVVKEAPFLKEDEALLRKMIVDSLKAVTNSVGHTYGKIFAPLSRIVVFSTALGIDAYKDTKDKELKSLLELAIIIGATSINTALVSLLSKIEANKLKKINKESQEVGARVEGALGDTITAARSMNLDVDFSSLSREDIQKMNQLNIEASYIDSEWSSLSRVVEIVLAYVVAGLEKYAFKESGAEAYRKYLIFQELVRQVNSLIKGIKKAPVVTQYLDEVAKTVAAARSSGKEKPESLEVELIDVQSRSLSISSELEGKVKFEMGKTYHVVGASGAGKSTLQKVIMWGDSLTERGLIKIGGVRYQNLDRSFVREKIVCLSQFYRLRRGSLVKNITDQESLNSDQVSSLEESVKAVGFDFYLQVWKKIIKEKYPGFNIEDALQDILLKAGKDEPGITEISGGQEKLMGFLRLDYQLRTNPEKIEVIMIDEPTSGLDNIIRDQIHKLVMGWRVKYSEKMFIIVNHEKDFYQAGIEDQGEYKSMLDSEDMLVGIEADGTLSQFETVKQMRGKMEGAKELGDFEKVKEAGGVFAQMGFI
ncbi:MAG: ATP-binding cassette domain-containing protein, partial [Asgard group archaeon]|nr:ATP-binding cassette domain-containing protein [Asgard group archaeon]